MRQVQIALLAAIAAILLFSGYKLWKWNRGDAADAVQETEDGAGDDGETSTDDPFMDQIFYLTSSQLESKVDDGRDTILCLGNDSFAWDYENGLAAKLRDATGAEVRNGAFPGSTVTLQSDEPDLDRYPEDTFSFYHIAADIAANDFSDMESVVEARREEDYYYQHAYDELKNTDFAALDTLLIYYDAQDYLRQRSAYNPDDDKMYTDLKTMMGAYSSGIRQIRAAWPHIRVVLVTPALILTYTPEGTPVSADRFSYGHGVLGVYVEFCMRVGEACGVTVLDNYHNMVEEDNANGYMADTTHLSPAGNDALVRHIVSVLYP